MRLHTILKTLVPVAVMGLAWPAALAGPPDHAANRDSNMPGSAGQNAGSASKRATEALDEAGPSSRAMEALERSSASDNAKDAVQNAGPAERALEKSKEQGPDR